VLVILAGEKGTGRGSDPSRVAFAARPRRKATSRDDERVLYRGAGDISRREEWLALELPWRPRSLLQSLSLIRHTSRCPGFLAPLYKAHSPGRRRRHGSLLLASSSSSSVLHLLRSSHPPSLFLVRLGRFLAPSK